MKLKPAGGFLLVRPLQKIPPIFQGIVSMDDAGAYERVVCVEETSHSQADISDIYVKGDKLLINPKNGIPVTVKGERCLIISCRDVLAFFEY